MLPSYISKNRFVFDANSKSKVHKDLSNFNCAFEEYRNFKDTTIYITNYKLRKVKFINCKNIRVIVYKGIKNLNIHLSNTSIYILNKSTITYNTLHIKKDSFIDILITSSVDYGFYNYNLIKTYIIESSLSRQVTLSSIQLSKDIYYCIKTNRYVNTKYKSVCTYSEIQHLIDDKIKNLIIDLSINLI